MQDFPDINLDLNGSVQSTLTDTALDSQAPAPLPVRKLFHWTDDPECPLILRIDWSSLESLLACNRSAEYKLVHSRVPPTKSALIFGAAFHSALEAFYKRDPSDSVETILSIGGRAIQAEYALHPSSCINDYRTADFCYSTFSQYVAQYFHESFKPVIYEGKPLVEFTFSFPVGRTKIPASIFKQWGYGKLTSRPETEVYFAEDEGRLQLSNGMLNCQIEWSGIVDSLMLMGDGETIRVWDHKTTSILSDAFFNAFQVSMQPIGYVTAMRAAFPDLKIKGFMLNCIACRKPTKTGQSYESYRRPYDYSLEQEQEFLTDLLALIGELFHNLASKTFPKKTNWCAGKYGACPYLDVCSAPASQRPLILSTGLFADNTWKPGAD